MTAQQPTTTFESRECTRCHGTGKHSYNARHGTTCYGCGGSGVMLTRRGAAARRFYQSLSQKRADQLAIGDVIRDSIARGTVTDIVIRGSVYQIATTGCGLDASGETLVRVALPADEKREAMRKAMEFQATLNKSGKPV